MYLSIVYLSTADMIYQQLISVRSMWIPFLFLIVPLSSLIGNLRKIKKQRFWLLSPRTAQVIVISPANFQRTYPLSSFSTWESPKATGENKIYFLFSLTLLIRRSLSEITWQASPFKEFLFTFLAYSKNHRVCDSFSCGREGTAILYVRLLMILMGKSQN